MRQRKSVNPRATYLVRTTNNHNNRNKLIKIGKIKYSGVSQTSSQLLLVLLYREELRYLSEY